MVCSGALGFILLFLLHPALGVDNLKNIIDYLYENYGDDNQFALGINVNDSYCKQGADLDRNFLPDDNNSVRVRRDMKSADRIYNGTRLIGARPKQILEKNGSYHAEYLLLNRSSPPTLASYDPLMQTLLDKYPNGCTVFYTLNSPCVKTCSTPNTTNSIIPALGMFQNRNTPKAFVFSYVWKYDDNIESNWTVNLKVINRIIPVFRCDKNGCVPCVNNQSEVNQNCTRNRH